MRVAACSLRAGALVLVVLLGIVVGACVPSRFIITEGSHGQPPPPETRVAVWGLRPAVTNAAVTWLRRLGFSVVEPEELQRVFTEQDIRVTRSFEDERHVLRVAQAMEIGLVVLTQSAVGETVVGSAAATTATTPFPGSIPTTFSHASVSLRGIEVKSGKVLFSGMAKYPQQLVEASSETLSMLTCQALATAWGHRPGGKFEIPPQDTCMIGK